MYLLTRRRMLVTQTSFVMPTQWMWLIVIILCAFPAQVIIEYYVVET